MNLHGAVAGVISAVNPMIPVTARISVGNTTAADGGRVPAYATPGQITAAIAGTTLTVSAVASGVLQAGQTLADLTSALLPGTTITGQIDGAPGGVGDYSVNQPQTVASEAMTTSVTLIVQLQALSGRDLRQIEGLNLQGTLRAIYVYGDINGIVRASLKGGDLITLADGSVWLVTLVLEPWSTTAGWTKAVVTLQNNS